MWLIVVVATLATAYKTKRKTTHRNTTHTHIQNTKHKIQNTKQPIKGHEDHIGALPWVVPALDPQVPIYGGGFVLQLVARRLQEFNLYDPNR